MTLRRIYRRIMIFVMVFSVTSYYSLYFAKKEMTRQASRRLCNAKTSSDASEAQQIPELLSKPLVCLGAGRIGHLSLVLLGLAWEKSEAQPKPLVGPKKQVHLVQPVAQHRHAAL